MSGHDHGGAATGFGEAARRHRRRLGIAFGITFAILLAEVVGAALTGSLALLVDAGHMLTDAGGLVMALVASALSTRPATSRRTWGYRRAEVLAATAQSAVLLAVGVFVVVVGVERLFAPPEIPSRELLVFGVIGLAGNLASLTVLFTDRAGDFNLRAAFLEVLNDAIGSIAVIVAAVIIAITGWGGADAVAGILIGVLILPRAFRLLRETTSVLLESTPPGLDLDLVREHILAVPEVQAVHDLHATQVASGLPVLTAHVTVDAECFSDGRIPRLLDRLQDCVSEHFPVSVEHSTFQLEPPGHAGHEHAPH